MPLLIFESSSLIPHLLLLLLFLSNTFRPTILDEQSQKQNELEQPRWEQMARNCLVEEARESIFTRPGGVAVARRERGRGLEGGWGGEKCRCICFDQIWPRGSIWKIFITRTLGGEEFNEEVLRRRAFHQGEAESTAAHASQIQWCKNCKTFRRLSWHLPAYFQDLEALKSREKTQKTCLIVRRSHFILHSFKNLYEIRFYQN